MTRINLVHVQDLADQHLFAEWRELKMVPAKVRKNLANAVPMDNLPKQYTLSTGHVRFFYDKLGWLYLRFQDLTKELRARDYNIPSDFEINAYGIFLHEMPDDLVNSRWIPSNEEIKINVKRIEERLNQRPDWYRYYGDVYSPDFFIDRYNQQLLVDVLDNSIV
jgi:deoxyribonuclease (pyrimidine dimer)